MPTSPRIRRLHAMAEQAKFDAITDMIGEVEAAIERVEAQPLESLTHAECETDADQIGAMKTKIHRPQVELECLRVYRTLLYGKQYEALEAKDQIEAGIDPLTGEAFR